MFSSLMAVSPLDGRYRNKIEKMASVTSEYGLIKFRVTVEIRWLEMLTDNKLPGIKPLTPAAKKLLNDIITNFNEKDAIRVKEIESETNHDVKAVEYFIKEHIKDNAELDAIKELVHFGCTSEDINNLAYAMMVKTARDEIILPTLKKLNELLRKSAHDYADIAMLARTHGQAATPTTVGKEFANFVYRLDHEIAELTNLHCKGKLNGATGNYSALAVAYPDVDWQAISKKFVANLGFEWNPYTTQIESHDYIAEFSNIMHHTDTILIGFCRDMWSYISIDYFKQKVNEKETGSSTMPHKVNPIDFENAEGNFGVANAGFHHLAEKLPISRWQRDLTDSTVLRFIGVPIGHSYLALLSTIRGLEKVSANIEHIKADLDSHWEVLTEPVQMVMRKHGIENPYEQLKAFSRGKQMTQSLVQQFISDSKLPPEEKKRLLELTPSTYTGYAAELAKKV